MAIDFSDRRSQLKRQQAGSLRFVRVVVRIALLFAIGALAVLQGFSPTSWLLLALLLAWGASMPFLLRAILRRVRALDHLAAVAAVDPDLDRGADPDRRLRGPGAVCPPADTGWLTRERGGSGRRTPR